MSKLLFPSNFLWGASTSAYQIEGAYNEEGKGESIWDRFTRWDAHILNAENGNIACDHYHRMPQDVALLKELGIPNYSFTISWTRILPDGRGKINHKGLDFYDRLVDTLLDAGIRPKCTLYHWDFPQRLQEQGGWVNRDSVNWFGDYAQIVFDKLANRVKMWATHNEPWVASFLGYASGLHAPGICDYSKAYQTAHHMLMAHGKAVQIYRETGYDGEIGLILNLNGFIPASGSAADIAATRRVHDETHALFLEPVFNGTYPQALFEYIGAHQPEIHERDLQLIHQPIDFLGLNYYNSDLVQFDIHGGLNKARLIPFSASGWGQTEMNWGIHPQGIIGEVLHVKEQYGNPDIYITENGCAMPDQPDQKGFVADWDRIRYLKAHLQALHKAIERGANVKGYFVWSLFDNFEWERGYTPRFGLVRIDYKTQARIPKQSAYWYRDIIAQNGIDI
jgi:beta-glucosidase